ncbi:NPH1 [Symbiodinium natans]|uniref:NPH1 protein n=1 Tax=Symbiodinium natans TaxID=878477 RepID=A0A812PJD4_9DINO|nr:NPH1 [Symbiodinium natans]
MASKQLCCRVVLRTEALQSYVLRSCIELRSRRRLQAYCNLHVFSGAYHDGRHGCKSRVLNFPHRCAPKFWRLAQMIANSRQKTLVLVSRGTGYRAAIDVLRQAASRAFPPFEVASTEKLAEFNSAANLRGELFPCMVADSSQCGEGVSFRTVRQLFLLDVPPTPTSLVQICGRASRMLGHEELPPKERTVRVQIFIATLPEWARQPLGHWCLLAAARKGRTGCSFERRARALFSPLVDKVGDLRKLKGRLVQICKKKASQLQPRSLEEPAHLTASMFDGGFWAYKGLKRVVTLVPMTVMAKMLGLALLAAALSCVMSTDMDTALAADAECGPGEECALNALQQKAVVAQLQSEDSVEKFAAALEEGDEEAEAEAQSLAQKNSDEWAPPPPQPQPGYNPYWNSNPYGGSPRLAENLLASKFCEEFFCITSSEGDHPSSRLY